MKHLITNSAFSLTLFILLSFFTTTLFSQVKTDSIKVKGQTVKIIEYSLFEHEQTIVYYDESLIDSFEVKPEQNIIGTITMDSIKQFAKSKGYKPTGASTCDFDMSYKLFNPNDKISNPLDNANFPSYNLKKNSYQFDLFHITGIDYYYSKRKNDSTDYKALLNLTKLWISYLGPNINLVKVEKLKPEELIDEVLRLYPSSIEALLIKAQLHLYFMKSTFHDHKEQKKQCKKTIKKVLKLEPTNETALQILDELKKSI